LLYNNNKIARFTPVGKTPTDFHKAKVAAETLNDVGIPGLRYLDAGSRCGVGDQSHNVVMYNDKLIDLIRRYGIAGMAGGGAAAAALPGQQDDGT